MSTEAEIDRFLEALDEALGSAAPRLSAPTGESAPEPARGRTPSLRDCWRNALVTGAARGLGAAIAEALARRGCNLTLVGREAASLTQLAGHLREAFGIEAEPVPLDLADAAAREAWIAGHGARLASVDLLINNAARADAAVFVESDPAAERAAIETNLFAPTALTRAVLPGMLERGRGTVLNVATTGARNAFPLFSSYAASKGALWAWSEALGRELAGTGVTVTTLVPPHMDSATRRQLGRAAAGFYVLDGDGGATTAAAVVAERALAGARAGRRLIASSGTRWMLALNALLPGRIDAQLGKRWKGMGPGRGRRT